jgi:predicted RND superfamily exporter protein
MSERRTTWLTRFSMRHPRLVVALAAAVTAAFASQLAKITTDTDPKHMLPATSPVRQYNDRVEKDFALHPDVIVLGIVNDRGIVNRTTLARIVRLTQAIEEIPGVVTRDVVSLSTVDNVTSGSGNLDVRPVLEAVPESDTQLEGLRRSLAENPLFVNRIVSADGSATAIYVPIEPTANGKEIAAKIRGHFPGDPGDDRYFLAGDPVARDTFGAEMFRQMAVFAPIAGLVMSIALWLMFHSIPLIAANMAVAMASITWSMGLLVGLGYPVHIMSSMSPIFLMAIATDSVHIFNEFAFRFREQPDKRQAVIDTMAAVGRPVLYSDLTTATGFAALATATIVPVKIFGLVVAFGTLVILLLSFTLVPAVLVLLNESQLRSLTRSQHAASVAGRTALWRLGEFCVRKARGIALAGAILLVIAAVGLSRIKVNNNMVHWFKFGSDVRTADRVLNARLGGTSTAYLIVEGPAEDAMKDPSMLRTIEGLQRELERDSKVGKSFSIVDYLKRVNRALHEDDPAFDRIPDSADEVGQYLFLLGTAARPRDLDNVVDYPFQRANVHLQLKSWDAGVMADVLRSAEAYIAGHPFPSGTTLRPAGIAYFNLVWSGEVLRGMLLSFLAGLGLVLVLLVAQTGSLRWGVLMFVPLLFTIVLIYGAVGLAGKDFDMPIAVLSTLSLGMAIDFAIHFVARFQQRHREGASLHEALAWTVARPGKGILLNAILFALGFAVMVFADLTPYITVGVLMIAIMLLSALASVVYLPGLILLVNPKLRKGNQNA